MNTSPTTPSLADLAKGIEDALDRSMNMNGPTEYVKVILHRTQEWPLVLAALRTQKAGPTTEDVENVISAHVRIPASLNPTSVQGVAEAARAVMALYARPPADDVARLRAALEWYAEQAEGCRKLGSIGDPARQALDRDGGKRAREALNPTTDQRPDGERSK